jgi:hypothetical protein
MASERQIAANRRNARKSTGPRSGAGKKRASRNAYRHGLTLSITSTEALAKQLETLVRNSLSISTEARAAIESALYDATRLRCGGLLGWWQRRSSDDDRGFHKISG